VIVSNAPSSIFHAQLFFTSVSQNCGCTITESRHTDNREKAGCEKAGGLSAARAIFAGDLRWDQKRREAG
jgi:hypothetical protein